MASFNNIKLKDSPMLFFENVVEELDMAFFSSDNWKKELFDIFEKRRQTLLDISFIPATPEQETNSRHDYLNASVYSKVDFVMRSSIDSFDDTTNDSLLFVPETQPDPNRPRSAPSTQDDFFHVEPNEFETIIGDSQMLDTNQELCIPNEVILLSPGHSPIHFDKSGSTTPDLDIVLLAKTSECSSFNSVLAPELPDKKPADCNVHTSNDIKLPSISASTMKTSVDLAETEMFVHPEPADDDDSNELPPTQKFIRPTSHSVNSSITNIRENLAGSKMFVCPEPSSNDDFHDLPATQKFVRPTQHPNDDANDLPATQKFILPTSHSVNSPSMDFDDLPSTQVFIRPTSCSIIAPAIEDSERVIVPQSNISPKPDSEDLEMTQLFVRPEPQLKDKNDEDDIFNMATQPLALPPTTVLQPDESCDIPTKALGSRGRSPAHKQLAVNFDEICTPDFDFIKKTNRARIIEAEKLFNANIKLTEKSKHVFSWCHSDDSSEDERDTYVKRPTLTRDVKSSPEKVKHQQQTKRPSEEIVLVTGKKPKLNHTEKNKTHSVQEKKIEETSYAMSDHSDSSDNLLVARSDDQPRPGKFVLKTRSTVAAQKTDAIIRTRKLSVRIATAAVASKTSPAKRSIRLKSEGNADPPYKTERETRKTVAKNVTVSKASNVTRTESTVKPDDETKFPKPSRSNVKKTSNTSDQRSIKIPLSTDNSRNGSRSSVSSGSSGASVRRTSRAPKPKIMFTKCDSAPYMPTIHKLGAKVVETPRDCSVLVSNKVYRTHKLLSAIALGTPIISELWLIEMQKAGKLLRPDAFALQDPETEKRYNFVLASTLAAAKGNPLFAGYSILVTPQTRPPPDELATIIDCAGGKCMQLLTEKPRPGDTVLAISTKEDRGEWSAIRKRFPSITIVNTEGFMLSILRQNVNFSRYILNT